MKKLYSFFHTLFILVLPLMANSQQMSSSKSVVLTNVTIIDTKGSSPKSHMIVVITDSSITEIGKKGKVPIPKGALMIDASNKFLIPGLWDMHVHNSCGKYQGNKIYLPLFIANGITSVRDMGGPDSGNPDTVFRTRQEIKDGMIPGPRIVAAGYFIMGDVRGPREVVRVSNDSEGRRAVDFIKHSGADFIKVKELVPAKGYFGIANEARKQQIPLVGHVPFSVDAFDVANAGQKSIEHLDGIWFACSTKSSTLRNQVFDEEMKMFSGKTSQASSFQTMTYALDTAIRTLDKSKADSLFKLLVHLGTYVCPTLTINQSLAYSSDTNFTNSDRLNYIPKFITDGWNPKSNGRIQTMNTNDYALLNSYFQQSLRLVKMMFDAGVKLLAGTDTSPNPNSIPYLFPGFSLLDELQLEVKAGLTPLEALQTATLNPSVFLGLQNRLGTIETGKLADLVLLDANPLQNIRNISKIDAVILNGKLIDKPALQNLLLEEEAAAKK